MTETKRAFIISQSKRSGSRCSFTTEAGASQMPLRTQCSVLLSQTAVFVLSLFLWWLQNGCHCFSVLNLHMITPKCERKTSSMCLFLSGKKTFLRSPLWMDGPSGPYSPDRGPCSSPSCKGGKQYWSFSRFSFLPIKVQQQDRSGGWAGCRRNSKVQLDRCRVSLT